MSKKANKVQEDSSFKGIQGNTSKAEMKCVCMNARSILNKTRALLRLERTMNLLEGGKGGWGREGGEGTEGGWGERVGRGRGGEREGGERGRVREGGWGGRGGDGRGGEG